MTDEEEGSTDFIERAPVEDSVSCNGDEAIGGVTELVVLEDDSGRFVTVVDVVP